MAISKVWIEEGCIGCGFCEEACNSVFLVTQFSTVASDVNYSDFEKEIDEADVNCPVAKIKVLHSV